VSRNLIRRLARAAFAEHLAEIPAGHWLVRLRSPFGPREFVSASSQALMDAVRGELERLVSAIGRRAIGRAL
jgi:ribonuclease P protein component